MFLYLVSFIALQTRLIHIMALRYYVSSIATNIWFYAISKLQNILLTIDLHWILIFDMFYEGDQKITKLIITLASIWKWILYSLWFNRSNWYISSTFFICLGYDLVIGRLIFIVQKKPFISYFLSEIFNVLGSTKVAPDK